MINLILDKQQCKMEELKLNMINNNNMFDRTLARALSSQICTFCFVIYIYCCK